MLDQAESMRLTARVTPPTMAFAATASAAAIAAAEAFIAYWDVSIGALVDGALLLFLVNRFLFAGTAAPDGRDRLASPDAALALALVPLLRLLSLSMTVEDLAPAVRYVVVGAPLIVATLLAVFLGPFQNVAVSLTAWSWRVQAPIGLLGIPFGLAAFAVAGRPDGVMDGGNWGSLAFVAAVAFATIVAVVAGLVLAAASAIGFRSSA